MGGERHGRGMGTVCYVWIGLYFPTLPQSLYGGEQESPLPSAGTYKAVTSHHWLNCPKCYDAVWNHIWYRQTEVYFVICMWFEIKILRQVVAIVSSDTTAKAESQLLSVLTISLTLFARGVPETGPCIVSMNGSKDVRCLLASVHHSMWPTVTRPMFWRATAKFGRAAGNTILRLPVIWSTCLAKGDFDYSLKSQ